MRLLALLLVASPLVLNGCCQEGYVRPKQSAIELTEVPSRARTIIERAYDKSEIESVERGWFHSRCTPDWEQYRFHLRSGQTITLDENGKLDKWFWDSYLPAPGGAG